MAVRLEKAEPPADRADAGRPRVSLSKPATTTGGASQEAPQTIALPVPIPSVSPSSPDQRGPAGSATPRRLFGRLALTAAFILGAVLAGAIGGAVAASRGTDLAHTRAQLASSRQNATALRGHLEQTTSELEQATSELASTSERLTKLQSQSADVAARADSVRAQEEELAQRSAALTKRDKTLASREASVRAREAALASPQVDHPLLDSIMDDGTWIVGRDIKPGTWTSGAYDTGCTWRTSDGRSGAGDGSYNEMEVDLQTGQSFTVHGCTMWDNYG